MEDVQSWWEVPSIAHFCSLFRMYFDLVDFDIEDLEEALITDNGEDGVGNSLVQDLIVHLLRGCFAHQKDEITSCNYQMYLRRLFRAKCEEDSTKHNPFDGDVAFHSLLLRTKVEILKDLCDFRLQADDVVDLIQAIEAESLRVQPLGRDSGGSTYWYFFGTRLYREDYSTVTGPLCSPGLVKGKQGGKHRKSNKSKRKVQRKWQVVCYTEEDWQLLTRKFKNCKSPHEKKLHTTLQNVFLPELPRLFAEKERLQRKRMMDAQLVRRNRSSSVFSKDPVSVRPPDSEEEDMGPGEAHKAEEDEKKRRLEQEEADRILAEAIQKQERSARNLRDRRPNTQPSHGSFHSTTLTAVAAKIIKQSAAKKMSQASLHSKKPKATGSRSKDSKKMKKTSRMTNNSLSAALVDDGVVEMQAEDEAEDEDYMERFARKKNNKHSKRRKKRSNEDNSDIADVDSHSKDDNNNDSNDVTDSGDGGVWKAGVSRRNAEELGSSGSSTCSTTTSGISSKSGTASRNKSTYPGDINRCSANKYKKKEETRKKYLDSCSIAIGMKRKVSESQAEVVTKREKAVNLLSKLSNKKKKGSKYYNHKHHYHKAEETVDKVEKILYHSSSCDDEEGQLQDLLVPCSRSSKTKVRSSLIFSQTEEDIKIGMHKTLEHVKSHEDAWPFALPVDEEYAPNYYRMVIEPMDLQTMEYKLDNDGYANLEDFKKDFQRIVENCRRYNGPESEYTEMVENLEKAFKKAIKKYVIPEESDDEEISIEYNDDGHYRKKSASAALLHKKGNQISSLKKHKKFHTKHVKSEKRIIKDPSPVRNKESSLLLEKDEKIQKSKDKETSKQHAHCTKRKELKNISSPKRPKNVPESPEVAESPVKSGQILAKSLSPPKKRKENTIIGTIGEGHDHSPRKIMKKGKKLKKTVKITKGNEADSRHHLGKKEKHRKRHHHHHHHHHHKHHRHSKSIVEGRIGKKKKKKLKCLSTSIKAKDQYAFEENDGKLNTFHKDEIVAPMKPTKNVDERRRKSLAKRGNSSFLSAIKKFSGTINSVNKIGTLNKGASCNDSQTSKQKSSCVESTQAELSMENPECSKKKCLLLSDASSVGTDGHQLSLGSVLPSDSIKFGELKQKDKSSFSDDEEETKSVIKEEENKKRSPSQQESDQNASAEDEVNTIVNSANKVCKTEEAGLDEEMEIGGRKLEPGKGFQKEKCMPNLSAWIKAFGGPSKASSQISSLNLGKRNAHNDVDAKSKFKVMGRSLMESSSLSENLNLRGNPPHPHPGNGVTMFQCVSNSPSKHSKSFIQQSSDQQEMQIPMWPTSHMKPIEQRLPIAHTNSSHVSLGPSNVHLHSIPATSPGGSLDPEESSKSLPLKLKSHSGSLKPVDISSGQCFANNNTGSSTSSGISNSHSSPSGTPNGPNGNSMMVVNPPRWVDEHWISSQSPSASSQVSSQSTAGPNSPFSPPMSSPPRTPQTPPRPLAPVRVGFYQDLTTPGHASPEKTVEVASPTTPPCSTSILSLTNRAKSPLQCSQAPVAIAYPHYPEPIFHPPRNSGAEKSPHMVSNHSTPSPSASNMSPNSPSVGDFQSATNYKKGSPSENPSIQPFTRKGAKNRVPSNSPLTPENLSANSDLNATDGSTRKTPKTVSHRLYPSVDEKSQIEYLPTSAPQQGSPTFINDIGPKGYSEAQGFLAHHSPYASNPRSFSVPPAVSTSTIYNNLMALNGDKNLKLPKIGTITETSSYISTAKNSGKTKGSKSTTVNASEVSAEITEPFNSELVNPVKYSHQDLANGFQWPRNLASLSQIVNSIPNPMANPYRPHYEQIDIGKYQTAVRVNPSTAGSGYGSLRNSPESSLPSPVNNASGSFSAPNKQSMNSMNSTMISESLNPGLVSERNSKTSAFEQSMPIAPNKKQSSKSSESKAARSSSSKGSKNVPVQGSAFNYSTLTSDLGLYPKEMTEAYSGASGGALAPLAHHHYPPNSVGSGNLHHHSHGGTLSSTTRSSTSSTFPPAPIPGYQIPPFIPAHPSAYQPQAVTSQTFAAHGQNARALTVDPYQQLLQSSPHVMSLLPAAGFPPTYGHPHSLAYNRAGWI